MPSDPTHFEILAYTGGKLRVNGFELPVVVDLAGLDASGEIPIAIEHDTDGETVLGQADPSETINDGTKLVLAGPITADPEQSPKVKRIIAMAAKGHKWQASIGAQIEEKHDVPAGRTVAVNGQDLTGPFTLATKSTLRETSVLGMGADKNTRVTLSASLHLDLRAEQMADDKKPESESTDFAAMLAAAPEAEKPTIAKECAAKLRAQADKMEAEFPTEKPADSETDKEGEAKAEGDAETDKEKTGPPTMSAHAKLDVTARLNAERKQEADDLRARAKIKALCKGDDLLCAEAIEKGWSAEKTELEQLRRQRSAAPAGHSKSSSPTDMLQAIQGGMLIRAGAKIDNPAFCGELGFALNLPQWLRAGVNADQRQKAMEAAWRFRDMSMLDLCRAAAQIDGNNSQYLDGSNSGFIRAAVSGGSLADIFTTNINAVLIEKLIEAGDTTAGWTREADAANFQTMDRIRLVKGAKLTKHRRGGTADSATRSDEMESYKIARYSQQFSIDEQDIIDDRFQALKDIPDEMALACGRLRPDLVYSIIMANANLTATGQALFSATQPGGGDATATQSNLATGSALSSATLQAGMSAMFNFLENGVGLNLYPTHILVPMVLAGLAYNLLQGQNIALAGTAGTVTERGDVNPLAALQAKFGKIEVVTDQRLTNGVVDPNSGTAYSGSSTTWRLVSNKVPTIEVAYLRGSGRAPQVRQYMLDKGQWGIGWDVNMDIGAKAMQWRGFYEARA